MITQVSTQATFGKFLEWEGSVSEYQLDVETDLLEFPDRNLLTIQFGDTNTQWVFHLPFIPNAWLKKLRDILNNRLKLKLIHNAAFEYRVFAKHGIYLENIYDTMLVEQIICTGIDKPKGYHSLKELVFRYFGVEMSKELQKSFTTEALTPEQVEYAAFDVMYLQRIRDLQEPQIREANLSALVDLENEACLAFSDISHNGLTLDVEKWRANIELVQPLIDESEKKLNAYLTDEGPLRGSAIKLGFLQQGDELQINWKSAPTKAKIFTFLYPELAGSTKAIILKYLKTTSDLVLERYVEKDYSLIEALLVENHFEWLQETKLIILDGTTLLNWDSPIPRLKFFKTIWPLMPAGDAAQVELLSEKHPIGFDYRDYVQNKKLITSFGEEFIAKNVCSDGKVHTDFRQILDTGRVSSSHPNMQQIPAKESVGTRYRNAFICPPDWTFVDSDYASQELVIIAHLSKDPVWEKALQAGHDLHSVCAHLIFGRKWEAAADDDCSFMATSQKCKCKKHKTMRTASKTINFGLAYGMGPNKLASTLKIEIPEAEELIKSFFKSFPGIGKTLDSFGRFGIDNGFITTPAPFFRRRYFELHEYYKWDLPYFNKGRYVDYLCSIERASKNMPIQGAAADMTKLALVMIRNYINANGYRDRIKIVMQVHDQVTTICETPLVDMWKLKLTQLMEDAARVSIPSGLLKADTTSTEQCWSK